MRLNKIKLICDSASDIDKDFATKNNIDVLPITIISGGTEYRDYYDFEPDEFYKILDNLTGELPSTSQVTPEAFLNSYEAAKANGYDCALVITLNSLASGTYQSANIAKQLFLEKYDNFFEIVIIDSTSYSCLIAEGIKLAHKLVLNGENIKNIEKTLIEFFKSIKAFVAAGTLDNLIKKGRISKIQGFVGGILNIKPIVEIGNSEIVSAGKVRGSAQIPDALLSMLENNMDISSPFILVIKCKDCIEYDILLQKVKEKYSDKIIIEKKIGSVIAINIGTYLVGLGFISKTL